jgi:MSHA biogenesis protein MshP
MTSSSHTHHICHSRSSQQGFAVVAALFLLVVLAALGGVMLTISNTAQFTSAQDVQGSRAYWAARGGLEWAIAAVKASAPVLPAVLPPATCPKAAVPTVLDGFAMVVTCSIQVYSEADASICLFRLTSVATSVGAAVGSVGFVERSVSALLER